MFEVYWLSPSMKRDDRLEYASSMRMLEEPCPGSPGHAKSSRFSRPLKVIGPIHPLTDFEWSVFGDILVGPEVAEKIRTSGLTGAQFLPAQVLSTSEIPLAREVLEMRISGWGGMATAASGIHVIEKCSLCKRAVFSGYTDKDEIFNPDQWDGSDFFITWPLPRYPMITDDARTFITQRGFSGVAARPLSALPRVVAGTLTPGCLEDWFDNNRAQSIRSASGKSMELY